jgi:hypothetical protein
MHGRGEGMIDWTVRLKTSSTEPQSGCTVDGRLTGQWVETLKWLFPQEQATLHALRYGRETLTFR